VRLQDEGVPNASMYGMEAFHSHDQFKIYKFFIFSYLIQNIFNSSLEISWLNW